MKINNGWLMRIILARTEQHDTGGGRGRVGNVSRAGNGSWLGWGYGALLMPEMVEISILQRCYGGDGCSVGLCGPCWVLGGP